MVALISLSCILFLFLKTANGREIILNGLAKRHPDRLKNRCFIPTMHRSREFSSRGVLKMCRGVQEKKQKVALVTGAGRGIGKAVALKLAEAGVHHVICVSRGDCSDVVKLIKDRGAEASSYSVDVGSPADVAAVCDKILLDHDSVDILVNNAGITKDNLFLRMSEAEWLDVINTNLNSVFFFTSPIIKKMIRQRYGRIVNMASVIGLGGNPGQANYAASKAGVIGFTRSLAKEVASRGVTVNAVAPGFIQTQMTDAMTQQAKDAAVRAIPAGRMGTGDEVADAVVFLASDNAAYITGKVLPVDGGMLFGGS